MDINTLKKKVRHVVPLLSFIAFGFASFGNRILLDNSLVFLILLIASFAKFILGIIFCHFLTSASKGTKSLMKRIEAACAPLLHYDDIE